MDRAKQAETSPSNDQCPKPKTSITYSPAYTLVPTYECFNRCAYCNFRQDPGQSPWLTIQAATERLEKLMDICEILILTGEVHPQSPRRGEWFRRIYDLCQIALEMGFLPHTNAGPLSFLEMATLKEVNVSMGLMLEQVTPALMETVHHHAPSKVPVVRLQQLVWAGELKIPFTTGLLLGIGETVADRRETLEAIANLHRQWGHIQEVILQPHSLGNSQPWDGATFSAEELIATVTIARDILPPEITIQIPPNLMQSPAVLLACLQAGARDLGGIGPKDEVNPDYPHPQAEQLRAILEPAGWQLVPRLPVYAQYDRWLPGNLRSVVTQWRDRLQKSL